MFLLSICLMLLTHFLLFHQNFMDFIPVSDFVFVYFQQLGFLLWRTCRPWIDVLLVIIRCFDSFHGSHVKRGLITGIIKLHNIFYFPFLRRILDFLSVPLTCSNFRTRCPKKAKLSHGRRIFAACVRSFQTIAGTLRKPYIRSPEQKIKFLCNLM